jgi:hypothetical protein
MTFRKVQKGAMTMSKQTMDPEERRYAKRYPVAYQTMERFQDAYNELSEAADEYVSGIGWRLSLMDDVYRAAYLEKHSALPTPEDLAEDLAARRLQLEAAQAQWAVAVTQAELVLARALIARGA